MYGNPDDYYYIDEGGNLVEPQRPNPDSGPGPGSFPVEGEQAVPGPAAPTRRPGDETGQAASDDFLDRATGSSPPPAPAATQRPRSPVPQSAPIPRPQF